MVSSRFINKYINYHPQKLVELDEVFLLNILAFDHPKSWKEKFKNLEPTYLTAWDIFKNIKQNPREFFFYDFADRHLGFGRERKNFTLSYKNIRKRLRKLFEQGLIGKVQQENGFKHRAIKYKLTDTGIFYLFLHNKIKGLDKLVKLKQTDIYKEFINPYFKKETLERLIYYRDVEYLIIKYLQDCCQNIVSSNHYFVSRYQGLNNMNRFLEIIKKIEFSLNSMIIQIAMINFKEDKQINEETEDEDYERRYYYNQLYLTLLEDQKYMTKLNNINTEFSCGLEMIKKASLMDSPEEMEWISPEEDDELFYSS